MELYYHTTDSSNRENIMREGLRCRIGDSTKLRAEDIGVDIDKLTPRIYLAKGKPFNTTYDDDVWIVDSEFIKNVEMKLDTFINRNLNRYWYIEVDIPKEYLKLDYEGRGGLMTRYEFYKKYELDLRR